MEQLPQVLAIDSQRNGVSGEVFTTAIVLDDDEMGGTERYLIVYCPERDPKTGILTGCKYGDGLLSFVNSLDRVNENDLSTHWRGDRMFNKWLPELRRAEVQAEFDTALADAEQAEADVTKYKTEGDTKKARRSAAHAQFCREKATRAHERLATIA